MSVVEVRLRPLVATDARALASWSADYEFCAHAGWSLNATDATAVDWWTNQIMKPDPQLIRLLATSEGAAVGYIDLFGQGTTERELGYVIGPSHRWGSGLGTAAARAGLAYGFLVLGLDRIWAEAVEANVASVRVLRRIGMRETGVGADEQFLGEQSRYLRFELLRSDCQQDASSNPPSGR